MSGLKSLELHVFDVNVSSILSTCTFPHLQYLECYFKLTMPVILFMNRHPDIYHLALVPNTNINQINILPDSEQTPTTTLPLIILPKLLYFAGKGEHAALIFRAPSSIYAVALYLLENGMDDVIAELEEPNSGDPSLYLLACTRKGWNIDLIDSLSRRLPRLTILSITNILPHDAQFPPEVS